MSGVWMLHSLKDSWKIIKIYQDYTMALTQVIKSLSCEFRLRMWTVILEEKLYLTSYIQQHFNGWSQFCSRIFESNWFHCSTVSSEHWCRNGYLQYFISHYNITLLHQSDFLHDNAWLCTPMFPVYIHLFNLSNYAGCHLTETDYPISWILFNDHNLKGNTQR